MCIVLISTSHPKYALIVAANRDEFLLRPTAIANFWKPPNGHVLGGRDLHREVQGTWLGVTRDGRIAVLTNVHEETSKVHGHISRGAMVNAFLTPPPATAISTTEFAQALAADDAVRGTGGFSLMCGKIGEPLAIVSNRTSEGDVTWVASGRHETIGLSNAAFSDRSWPKVLQGEELLKEAIEESVQEDSSQHQLVDRLMEMLSVNTLPQRREGEPWDTYAAQMRKSIFIPKLGEDGALAESADAMAAANAASSLPFDSENAIIYGTQKQTVILVDRKSNVTFVERTLYGDDGHALESSAQEREFNFKISASS